MIIINGWLNKSTIAKNDGIIGLLNPFNPSIRCTRLNLWRTTLYFITILETSASRYALIGEHAHGFTINEWVRRGNTDVFLSASFLRSSVGMAICNVLAFVMMYSGTAWRA
ncbi:MAG: hypothetical protein DRR19_12195 [Candidatus Parabeggiatoa sp. nov. 1]|nr:MAG: hypothetical protein DRR19_12195 [Gammaproteobacteria bacterium]